MATTSPAQKRGKLLPCCLPIALPLPVGNFLPVREVFAGKNPHVLQPWEKVNEILEGIAVQEDKKLKKAMNEWERVSQDEVVRLAYEARRKSVLDEQSAIKRAESLGLEKGKIEVALKMIEEGMEDDLICRVTALPISRIQELRKQ